MGELRRGELLGLVVAAVDNPGEFVNLLESISKRTGAHQLAKYVALRYPDTARGSVALLAEAMPDTSDVGAAEVNDRKAAEARAKEDKSLENMLG